MSEQLVDLIHQQLNDAISNNLYTGLAYGTSPIRITSFLSFCSTHT
jgi:hypothetical protein